jgi:hypothetical protein
MPLKDKIAKYIFFFCAAIFVIGGSFGYGVLARIGHLFPEPQLIQALLLVGKVVNPSDSILDTRPVRHSSAVETHASGKLQPGLLLVAGDIADRQTAVRIIDRSGRIIHEWLPVWSQVWPDEEGEFPPGLRPTKGTHLHGIAILPSASIVANFAHLSTFMMDVCGKIKWKLDNLGHHSIHYADDGTLWVPAEKHIAAGLTGYPNHEAPLQSWTLQNISTHGEILQTIPVIDLFFQNDLQGLLYMSSLDNEYVVVSADTLHLNDIETFPAGWKSDIFREGDILISLRNINTIMVIDATTKQVKFISTGRVMRHHDPDFMPGNKISVFDNHNISDPNNSWPTASRVVEIDAVSGDSTTVLAGDGDEPFFTRIMGDHQRLKNGNILVVPSGEGRVLEFTKDGDLVWRYDNRVAVTKNRRIYNAIVLPEKMDEAFFREKVSKCKEQGDNSK